MSKRVFVTGGAGVIGIELVKLLIAHGYEVIVGDKKNKPDEMPSDVIYRQGDLNYLTQEEFDTFEAEYFIHLAATFERTFESKEFWDDNFYNNIKLSHHLMSLVAHNSLVRRVVFASSYLVYDPSLYLFDSPQEQAVYLKENDLINPRNLIGMSKLTHERELDFLSNFYVNFSTVSARIFRGYGRNSRDIISRWVRMLLRQEKIYVYRPENMFDYIYAADSAKGLFKLMESDLTGVVNLGTGKSRRVQDVIDVLHAYFSDIEMESTDTPIPFEASGADMTLFEKNIGWIPEYELETAIPEIIEFEKQRLGIPSSKKIYDMKINLLVTSSSAKVPLMMALRTAVKKISPKSNIIAADINKSVISSYFTDEFWVMPKTSEDNLQEIIDGCLQHGVNYLLPTRDAELLFWARHKELFSEKGINVLVAPKKAIEVCLDKLKFSLFGKQHDLPFIMASKELSSLNAERFVVKERFGAGSKSVFLDLSSQKALRYASRLKEPIFQPYIEGEEISIDAWLDKNSKVKGLVMRKREYVVHGESQVTTTFRNSSLEETARDVLERLELTGPVVMQAIIDSDGKMHIIECNPRFGGASTASLAAGLDSLFWSLLESIRGDVPDYPFIRISKELRQIRAPQDFYFVAK